MFISLAAKQTIYHYSDGIMVVSSLLDELLGVGITVIELPDELDDPIELDDEDELLDDDDEDEEEDELPASPPLLPPLPELEPPPLKPDEDDTDEGGVV